MKKILLSLAAVMTFGFANAATATFDFANGEWGTTTPEEITAPANGESLIVNNTVFTVDGISLSFKDMYEGYSSMMQLNVNLAASDDKWMLKVDESYYIILSAADGGLISSVGFDSDNLVNVASWSAASFDSSSLFIP